MRKFKLIKEYPGSPKLNTIVYKTKNIDKDFYIQVFGGFGTDNISIIENQPEYWEEIKEKKWKINSLEDGKIYSIKRLKDNQIFTIGEEIEEGIISNIVVTEEDVHIRIAKRWLYLEHANKKIHKLLFITEDRKEIFDNYKGQLYIVNKNTLELKSGLVVDYDKFLATYNCKNFLYFYSFYEVKNYIIMNTPCLSLKDITKIYVTADKHDFANHKIGNKYKQSEQIYKLVQTKLKL